MSFSTSSLRTLAGTLRQKCRFQSRALIVCAMATYGVLTTTAAHAEVKVGVSDWTGWVAWYVAENQGYFKKYGANVKLVWFANYSDSIAALSTGQLDANSQTWSDTLGPLQKGLPLKAVLVNDNSFGAVSLRSSCACMGSFPRKPKSRSVYPTGPAGSPGMSHRIRVISASMAPT